MKNTIIVIIATIVSAYIIYTMQKNSYNAQIQEKNIEIAQLRKEIEVSKIESNVAIDSLKYAIQQYIIATKNLKTRAETLKKTIKLNEKKFFNVVHRDSVFNTLQRAAQGPPNLD